jgi:fido (protein-threonine AMPylation protein)
MTDPYVYPGTDVLRNKENIRDARELEAFERMATANRMETSCVISARRNLRRARPTIFPS